MNATVTFVTSFEPDMYRATGIHLLQSFTTYCPECRLLACTESLAPSDFQHAGAGIDTCDITENPVLTEWLKQNSSIIPRHLGGTADQCGCTKTGFGVDEIHQRGCHYSWYNRNAARWFRKIIALDTASRVHPTSQLIWLDSDCRFKGRVTRDVASSWFQSADGFYFKSPQRRVLESGILGLDGSPTARTFLSMVLERFLSGEFRRDPRWDDAYQIQAVINSRSDIKMVDLAPSAYPYHAEVIAASVVGRYIEHYRGTHGPVLRLMI
jgi:hypothetical protein